MSVNGCWTSSLKTATGDRKSTRLNSSHLVISYAVFCLKKKKNKLSPAIQNATRTSTAHHLRSQVQAEFALLVSVTIPGITSTLVPSARLRRDSYTIRDS